MLGPSCVLAALLAASPYADQVVVGVIDASPTAGVSALLDQASAWLRAHTALSAIAGDQVGLDRATLARCPADRLYTCLARALLDAPSRPRAALVIARARAGDAQVLVLDAATVAPLVTGADAEAQVYASVVRLGAPSTTEALDRLRAVAGFEAPAQARIEARGCDGCVVRVGEHDATISGAHDVIEGLRLRAGPARIEVSSGGRTLAATDVTLAAEQPARVRVEVPPARGWLIPAAASGLVLAGGGALAAGVAVATGRDDLLCVSHGAACAPDAAASADPRASGYADAGTHARVLVASGALAVAAGLVLWALELAHDDTPRLTVE